MGGACYYHAISAIQVKNVPRGLHEQLRERARAEGMNLSDYVLDVLRRDLTVPTMREWLERLERDEPVTGISTEEVVAAIHEGRAERNVQVSQALAAHD